jgi:argininosuccinate lyase
MKEWKGRFRDPLDAEALAFSSSLPVDKRLVREDIAGSLAHVAMLAARKIIPGNDAKKIAHGLKEILREIDAGNDAWLTAHSGSGRFVADDVHMAVEQRLTEKIGNAGARLHTARSRNDQVALDVRLFLRHAIDISVVSLRRVQGSLLRKAVQVKSVVMPGYTHLQRAQPVLLPHHLLAYVEMFERDRTRFLDCRKRANKSPLGAAALAGTSFPIDRRRVARQLHFDGVVENSIDAVSDRDAVLEFVSAAAVTMMHASRLAEELVLWTSHEWRFAAIGDAFATGSSIMPQKKNPDMAELIRGKTGRVYGDLVTLLTIMKGLPLAYNRDMQEDKEPLFDAADTVVASIDILAGMLATVTFDARRFEKELDEDFALATELADYLARRGVPFRKAHGIVGALVVQCQTQGYSLGELPLEEYKRLSKKFGTDVKEVLSARRSLALKRSEGSTAPAEVEKALRRWRRMLGKK